MYTTTPPVSLCSFPFPSPACCFPPSKAQHPPHVSLFHPFVAVIRTKFIDLSTKREMSYHHGYLFSFRGGKTLPGISATSTSPPLFSYLFFFCSFFTLSFRTRVIIVSISSFYLFPSPPSLSLFRWSNFHWKKNSILPIDWNTRGIILLNKNSIVTFDRIA